jgi:hypothetical protein
MSSFIPYAFRVQTMRPRKINIVEMTITLSTIAAPRAVTRWRHARTRFVLAGDR